MNRYYFFHIPKTAGSSLNRLIEREFSPSEIFSPHLWSQVISVGREELSGYRYFRGHFYSSFYDYADMALITFSFLRDPIERALSHYGHVCFAKEHYYHRAAIEAGGFEAYLNDPELSLTISNFQAKCLVNDKDPVAVASTLSDRELSNLELERIMESHDPGLSDQELFMQAIQRLESFEFFGLTERFDISLAAMRSHFGWEIPLGRVSENVNSNRIQARDLRNSDLKKLVKANAVDIELYQYAQKLFDLRT